jgi:mannose-6-phosphate isomerase-like protein (cupin superfamily)
VNRTLLALLSLVIASAAGCRSVPRRGDLAVEIDLIEQSRRLAADDVPEVLYYSRDQIARLIRVTRPIPEHRHRHSEETIYVLTGEGEMTSAGARWIVRAGDLIVVPRNTPHSLTPNGAGPLAVLSIHGPALEGGDEVLEAELEHDA